MDDKRIKKKLFSRVSQREGPLTQDLRNPGNFYRRFIPYISQWKKEKKTNLFSSSSSP